MHLCHGSQRSGCLMWDFSEPDREEGVVRRRCPKGSQRKGPRGTTGEAEQLRVGQFVDDARQLAGSWVVGLWSRLGHLGPGRQMGRRGQSPEAGGQRQRPVVMGRATMRCGSRGAAAGGFLIRAEGATADSGKGHGVGEVILQPEGTCRDGLLLRGLSVVCKQGKSHSVRRLELLMGPRCSSLVLQLKV